MFNDSEWDLIIDQIDIAFVSTWQVFNPQDGEIAHKVNSFFKKLNPKYNEADAAAESDGFKKILPGEFLNEFISRIGKDAD